MNRLHFLPRLACVFALLPFYPEYVHAQENIRTIDQPGDFTKFLTPGMVDRWIFDGLKNETVAVRVVTKEFDSVIQLVRVVGEEEELLLEIDDDGSNSSLAMRLPADGKYKIRVQGFERRGGGNYSLSLQQFVAKPIDVGALAKGSYDDKGNAWFRFSGEPELHFTVDPAGFTNRNWAVLDPQGNPIVNWGRMVRLAKKGEHVIHLAGQPNRQLELTLRPSQQVAWKIGQADDGTIGPRGSHVINLDCRPDEVRYIDLEATGHLDIRIIHAPPEDEEKKKRIARNRDRPEIMFLPVVSKGAHHRFAFVTGRQDNYQVQIQSELGVTYQADYRDPLEPAQSNKEVSGKLPVGASRFFVIDSKSARSISAELNSPQFDPLLRIFDSQGRALAHNDDGPVGLGSQIRHTTYSAGKLIAMVSSVGNGGGGDFVLRFRTEQPRRLKIGKLFEKQIGTGGTDQWQLDAKAGRTVIFHSRAETSAPRISVRNRSGVELARSPDNPAGNESVLAYRFPADGTYSIWIHLPRGTNYRLQTFATD